MKARILRERRGLTQIEKAVMTAGERPRRKGKQAPGPSGERIDARTALAWGLVDEVTGGRT